MRHGGESGRWLSKRNIKVDEQGWHHQRNEVSCWTNKHMDIHSLMVMMMMMKNLYQLISQSLTISRGWDCRHLQVSWTHHDSGEDDELATLSTCEPYTHRQTDIHRHRQTDTDSGLVSLTHKQTDILNNANSYNNGYNVCKVSAWVEWVDVMNVEHQQVTVDSQTNSTHLDCQSVCTLLLSSTFSCKTFAFL